MIEDKPTGATDSQLENPQHETPEIVQDEAVTDSAELSAEPISATDMAPEVLEEPAAETAQPVVAQPDAAQPSVAQPDAAQPSVAEVAQATETPVASHEEGEEDGEEDHDSLDLSKHSIDEIAKMAHALLKQEEDVRKKAGLFNKMKSEVERMLHEQEENARLSYVAEMGEEEGFEFKKDPAADRFFHEYRLFNAQRKERFQAMQKEREDNLKSKLEIIGQLKELVDAPEQKGSLEKVKALQKKWKSIGAVPQADAEDLYQRYNALNDLFYDTKNIEFELKELDRRKNLEAKIEICEKAEALTQLGNANDALRLLQKLTDDFKSIGPVPKDHQEEIWQRFKKAADVIYEQKRAFSEAYKQQLSTNLQAKQRLCLQLEGYVNFHSERIKEWNEKTKELLAIQKEWETIGPMPKEVAKEINRQFWSDFKVFFANKTKFLEAKDAERKGNLQAKEALCQQAEQLKESIDWDATAEKIKQLQLQWKEIGPVPESQREKIYQRFKAACDEFFNRRRNRRSEQDRAFDDNLSKKSAICQQIEDMATNAQDDDAKLAGLVDAFLEIGFVPKKDMNAIVERFVNAIDAYYDAKPGLDEDQLEEVKLKAHMELYKKSPSLAIKLKKREQNLRRKIAELENDISLWENNLQFFAHSKTADKLLKDFTARIADAKKKRNELMSQLDSIANLQ